MCRLIPAPRGALSGFRLHADVPRTDIDTAGFGLGASFDHWGFADTAGWPACAAIAEPRYGTWGYSIVPVAGKNEMVSRIP
jgi:hypothetical protein